MIIVKISMSFSPLRVFLPISVCLFGCGLGRYLHTYLSYGRFTNMSHLLINSSVIIFMLGLYFYFFMGVSPSSKRFIVAAIAAAYIFWSLHHHYKRGDLTTAIIIEYLVVALFGIVLFSGTFF